MKKSPGRSLSETLSDLNDALITPLRYSAYGMDPSTAHTFALTKELCEGIGYSVMKVRGRWLGVRLRTFAIRGRVFNQMRKM